MKKTEINSEILKVFQTSNSPDLLFDTFRAAIDKKVNDIDMYTALLWNKALSNDEIIMYAEKICKEIPEYKSKIYLTVAKIFDSTSLYGDNKELSFNYIKKAAAAEETSIEPYIVLFEIYNKELNLPPFEKIANFLEQGVEFVNEKSKLNFMIARLYGKVGQIEKGKNYQKIGEEYQRKGQ